MENAKDTQGTPGAQAAPGMPTMDESVVSLQAALKGNAAVSLGSSPPELGITPEAFASIKARIRSDLVERFHEYRVGAHVSRSVGDEGAARAQEDEMDKIVRMIRALDDYKG